jgi:hypothetical protein
MFIIYRLLLIVAIILQDHLEPERKSRRLPITTTQTIYFYDKSAGPCYVEDNFHINPSPAIDARPVEVLKCDANFVDDLKRRIL